MAEHASQLYARNVQELLGLIVPAPAEEGGAVQVVLDWDDEIVSGSCVARDGEIVHPGAKAAVEAAG